MCIDFQDLGEDQSPNPASGKASENAQGLGKLDAEAETDQTPVEQKVGEVASAMGLETQPEVGHSWSTLPTAAHQQCALGIRNNAHMNSI